MIRAALKSLLGRKLRLIMSTFAIVLGVAFVVGTLVFTDTLNKSFTSIFASGVGDVVVQAEGADDVPGSGFTSKRVSGTLVDTLAEVPGAARADGRAGADGVYVLKKSDGKPIGGFGPPSLGGNWTDAPAGHGLEGLVITQGREPDGADEVVLDARTADKAGYDVGDTVNLLTQGERANLTATLVGVADYRDGGSLNGATLAAFDTETAQELFYQGRDEFTSIWVTAEEGVTQDQLRAEVEKVLPDGYEAVTGDESADKRAEDLLEGISFLTTFLLIFAGIALFVGSFIIVNTFSILVAQRSRELALLRALGASKKQVVRSVQLEAFILGLLGATFGIALGVLLAMALRVLFGAIGLDLTGQPLVFAPRSFIAAYVVGVLVTMVAAYFPARRTSKIAPVQAMRDDVALPEESLQQRFRRGLALFLVGCVLLVVGLDDLVHVPKSGWVLGAGLFAILLGVTVMSPVLAGPVLRAARAFYSRVFGSIGNLAAQNSLRNPRRTAATASALMIGLTLACTMAIVGASAKATIDKSVETGFTGDYVVSSIFDGGFSPTIAEDVVQVPGVEKVLRQRTDFASYDGGFAVVVGTDVSTLDALGVAVVEGALADLEKKNRAVVDEVFADEEGLVPGDTFEIDVNAGTVEWKVAAVIKANVLLQGIVVSTDTFELAGYAAEDTALIVYAEPGADKAQLQQDLDEALKDQPIVTALDQEAFAKDQRAGVDLFVNIIYALLGLALVIAVLGIINTLALSVIERTREVGLLRAIGVTRRQLRRMITLESVVIAVLGAILGVVLGTGIGVVLMQALRDEGLDVIAVPVGQLTLFLVLAVVIGVIAAFLPARRAARLDVLQAIATE